MGLAIITVLFLLVVHALSAPSGCIESCTSYHRTYQTQTAGGYQDHAGLTQAVSNLDNVAYTRPGNWSEHNQYRTDGGHGNVHEERGQYVEGPKRVRYYKKNFTSSYSTSDVNGGGLSTSEQLNRGRYGTVYVPTSNQQILDSRRAYDQIGNLQTTSHQEEYNRIHRERLESVASHRADQSERLEDFGEYAGNTQHGSSRYDSHTSQGQAEDSSPSNWSRVDHYGTDGGRGHVFEEEGQYVHGPKKVRYFKRNYTSSYTSEGIPTSDNSATGTHEIHKEIEKLHREIDREIRHLSSTANRQPNIVPTIGATDYRHHASHDSLATSIHRNEEEHGSSVSQGPIIQVPHVSPIIQVPLVNPVIQVPHASPVVQVPHVSPVIQVPHVSPTQRVYTSERRHNSYERHEGYVPVTETEQRLVSPLASYSQIHTDRDSAFAGSRVNEHRTSSDLHQTELLNTHLSSNAEDHFGSDRVRQGAYDQQVVVRPTVPGHVSHYKEQFSSASHTRESTFPQVSSDTMHVNQETESERYNRHQYRDQHGSRSSQGRGSYQDQLRHSQYNSGYRTPSGNLATGVLDMGHVEHSADCTQDVEQVQYGSHYHRNYKRSAKYNEQDDMQHQRNDDLTQQTDHTNDQLQQQADDGFPETSGKLEFGQQTQYPEDDDLTQQTTGKFEFGQQQEYNRQSNKPRVNQEIDDMTQRTNKHLDFTQQSEDLSQQTAALDDFLQQFAQEAQRERQSQNQLNKPNKPYTNSVQEQNTQTSINPEFGQRVEQTHRRPITTGNEHLEDLTYDQQREDLTQQTSGYENFHHPHGHLEFSQQTEQSYPKPMVGNQHLEDLTQHAQLEFGQHGYNSRKPTVENQHSGNGNRESTRFPHEISGLEQVDRQRNPVYGQQTQWSLEDNRHNQHSDMIQQNEDLSQVSSSGFENFGQHSGYRFPSRKPVTRDHHPEDSTAHGTVEFGQSSEKPRTPTVENQHELENVMQQNEDLTQQLGGFDDLTQQTSGKLQFGQQTQYPQHTWRPATGNQHLEELTQQNEEFTQHTGDLNDHTQQTIGKLEFGQQTENDFQPWGQFTDLTQANEDSMQQTTGNLDFGQYQQKPHRPTAPHSNHHFREDLTQGQFEFGQHQQDNDAFEQTIENQYGNLYDQREGYRWDLQKPRNLQKEDLGQLSINLEFGQNPSTNDQVQHSDYRQESVPFYVGSQTTEEPIGVLPLEQESTNNKPMLTVGPKPAEKPKPRPRYSKPVVIEPHTENSDISLTGSHPALPKADPEVDLDDIRVGNLRGDQGTNNITDKDNRDSNTQTGVSASGIDRGNMDQVNLLHKSNDATVGLQWHYTYHPSDLTNSEPVQNTFYPGWSYNSDAQQKESYNGKNLVGQLEQQPNENENNPIVQQETKPVDIIESQSEDKDLVSGTSHQSGYGLSSQSHNQYHRVEFQNKPIVHQETKPVNIIEPQSEGKDQISGTYHQSEYGLSSQSHNQYHRVELQDHSSGQGTGSYSSTQNYGASQGNHREEERIPGVKGGHHRQPLQNQPREPRLESRIFEAYGGGPYDGTYTDDVYSRVTPSPSATLPPLNAEDPWDVREKPREYLGTTIIAEIIPDVPESTESPDATTEPPPPSFWGKLGNKITRTFDKAKEKARGIFG